MTNVGTGCSAKEGALLENNEENPATSLTYIKSFRFVQVDPELKLFIKHGYK